MNTMTEPERRQQINPVEFGRVIGHLEAIQTEIRDLKGRTVFRLDNLEGRVEKLEGSGSSQGVYIGFIQKAVWGVLGAVGILVLKAVGVM